MNFGVPVEHRVKIKEAEKIKPKKLWGMKVTVIPIIVGVLGMVHPIRAWKRGKLEIRGTTGALQTIKLIKSARMLISYVRNIYLSVYLSIDLSGI